MAGPPDLIDRYLPWAPGMWILHDQVLITRQLDLAFSFATFYLAFDR